MKNAAAFIVGLLVLQSCSDDGPSFEIPHSPEELVEVPEGFPPIEFPEGNEFTLSRWQLGKELFYDPMLSSNFTIRCGTCHKANLGFADDKSVTPGVNGVLGERNAPTLMNVTYHPYFTREGGVPTLEMQVLVPIQEHAEMDFNIVLVAERMAADTHYVRLSQEAYGREPDPFVITRAISAFERTLISGNSLYDKSMRGEAALSISAIRGMELFFSTRTKCSECHGGFNFTNYAFENNGLYESYPDQGRFRLTNDSADIARFKVPTLRNVGITAPYMHDGSIATLEQVIEHYNSGGYNHSHKSDKIEPLHLSQEEKNDLLSFLHSLTDQTIEKNVYFKE